MAGFDDYYKINPVSVVDQNTQEDRSMEVAMQFLTQPVVYTPLIDWMDRSAQTGAQSSIFTELLEGDVNFDEIAYDAQYIPDALGVDSRSRALAMARYGDKVMLHEHSQLFQQWKFQGGGRDWRPLLRGLLGNNVRRKIEMISRNAFLKGPKTFWTYANDKTSFGQLGDGDTFGLEIANAWNLRLGNTGSPVIPGGSGVEKVVIVPPGAVYDFQQSLAGASQSEAQMWRDARLLGRGETLTYEVGSYKNIRFVQAPNDNYGQNSAVLYNSGAIQKQVTVTSPINAGDGAPNPETTKVDETWRVGQKDVTHYIQCSDFAVGEFAVNDIVTIHTIRTNAYGVTNGVEPLSGKTITRRVVAVDATTNRLSFDRPVMAKYTADLGGGVYAYVTKAQHIGFGLVVSGRGGVMGNVNRPLKFYEPRPIDDFESVWRFVWDFVGGITIWEPNLFEPHFFAVSLPKPGGVIAPVAIS